MILNMKTSRLRQPKIGPGIGPYYPWSLYGTDYQKPAGALVIPDSVDYNGNAYPVKYIYKYAFSGCDSLTSVVIPDRVEWIMDSAFYGCSRLATVHLPDSLMFLDEYVFGYEKSLDNYFCSLHHIECDGAEREVLYCP